MKKLLLLTSAICLLTSYIAFGQYTKLIDFTDTTIIGISPWGSLFYDGAYLYGATNDGGIGGYGTIFKIKPDGTGVANILDFESYNGERPLGDLISDGTFLYGMTYFGGANDNGTVFKVMPDGTGYIDLFDFEATTTGGWPYDGLISDGTFLYGMTHVGGTSDSGTIFKIKPDGTGFSKLLDFTGAANGSYPYGNLISDGTFLYGMTREGGINDSGTIFKIKPDGTGYSKLLDFSGVVNGRHPQGSLISDGTFLYGMTWSGGANDSGTIFKIKPDGTGYSKLLDFSGASNGSFPWSSLIFDGTFLYGMTYLGGANNDGVIFKIKPDGTGYSKLLDFAGATNGSWPIGSLISDGNFLYGTTYSGGANNYGTVFKYNLNCTRVSFSQSPTICAGQSITVGSHTYTVSGTYTDVFPNGTSTGCDSTVTTYLTVQPADFAYWHTICHGQNIIIGSNTYSTSGTYMDTLTSLLGCDSIVTTHLTVLSSSSSATQTLTICSGKSVTVGTDIYTTSGTYTFTFQGSGCDSTIITNLTVNPTPTVSINGGIALFCNTGITTLTASGGGTYLWSTGSTDASIAVSPATATTYSVMAAMGSCSDTVSAIVSEPPTVGFTFASLISDPKTFDFSDSSVSSPGDPIVQWNWSFPGANPLSASAKNVDSIGYPSFGIYTACLTVTSLYGCKDSICKQINVSVTSVNETKIESSVSVYPNPTSGAFTVFAPSLKGENNNIEIYNLLGEKVYSEKILNPKSQILNIDVPNGIYFLQIKSNEGTTNKKIIINK